MAQTEQKICQNCKNQFVIEPDDFSFYAKMGVPPPNLCPACRFKRRAVFRNERTLYKRTCGLCGVSIITMYHPKSLFTVYCNDCWLSDKWDPFSYAMKYDPSKPFFGQLAELSRKVPKSATYSSHSMGPNINSEYANFAGSNKNAYLIFNCGPHNEDIAYSRGLMECQNTLDSYYGEQLERVYEGVSVHKSAGVVWGQNVTDSIDSWFLLNSSGCQNCFGCVNLRHKSYHFFNEPLAKDKWRERVAEVVGSYAKVEEMKKKFEMFALRFPRRETNNLKSVNVTGDYIFESKNCRGCFEVSNAEDCAYAFSIKRAKDCYDVVGHCRYSELILDCVGVGANSSRIIGSWWVDNAHDVEYSFGTRSSAYCFGCDAVKNAEYAILNKRYSETEYRDLRSRIVEELTGKNLYGVFMPPQYAFFAYNEGIGNDNMPLAKEEALAQGFRWEDDIPETHGKETLRPEQIPDHIKDVQDSIFNEVLACVSCGRNYRLIRAELDFYQRMMIPVPRKCFNCRHLDRLRRRGPLTLYDRTCAKCSREIKTNFAPDRPEIVYCEACYQSEVV